MNLWLLSPSASNRDCDVVCASLSYIADPAIHFENEKQATKGGYFCFSDMQSSSELELPNRKTKRPSFEGLLFSFICDPAVPLFSGRTQDHFRFGVS